PRLAPDKRTKTHNQKFYRRTRKKCDVKKTGFTTRPRQERQARFSVFCRDGEAEIQFLHTALKLRIQFFLSSLNPGQQRETPSQERGKLEREKSKVHLTAPWILNGVSPCWPGW
uniref:Uncharacterized protein n=1 Tax=Macaca mulatta TaxID=9544 RepID=A0A5F8AK74_MACMU